MPLPDRQFGATGDDVHGDSYRLVHGADSSLFCNAGDNGNMNNNIATFASQGKGSPLNILHIFKNSLILLKSPYVCMKQLEKI